MKKKKKKVKEKMRYENMNIKRCKKIKKYFFLNKKFKKNKKEIM